MSEKTKTVLAEIFLGVLLILLIFFVANEGYFAAVLSSFFAAESPSTISTNFTPDELTIPDRLVIESLGIDAPIIYVAEKSEKAFQEGLRNGVVHFPGTAEPGMPGNVYIFGHSSDYAWSKGGYKHIFATLPKVEIGAKIFVSDTLGRLFEYRVNRSFAAQASDTHLLEQGDGREKLLTLQTSYPIGTALRRWVVIAELVEEVEEKEWNVIEPSP